MPGPLRKPQPFQRKGKKLPGQSSDDDLGLDLRIRVRDRPSATIINKELVQVGNIGAGDYIEIDADAISLFADGDLHVEIQTDGDLFIGQDVSVPGKTYFSIFANNQTYNSESMAAGDMLIGDNSASKANILWDKSEGQLKFRGGGTTELYLDTDGSLVAGDGDVEIDSAGVTLNPGTSSTKKIKVIDGGTRIAEFYGLTDPGVSSQLTLVGRGRGGSGPITHEGLVEIIAITDDGSAHTGAASVTMTLETDNDTIRIAAGSLIVNKAAVFNELGGENNFRVESESKPFIFFVDSNADVIGIDTATPYEDCIMDIGDATKPIIIPILTDAQIAAVSEIEGMFCYNSDSGTLDYYDGASWLQLTGS
jgi:hypothetical protein